MPSQSLSGDTAPNTIRTAMESGLTRQRRRYTTEVLQLRVVWEFSDTEFGVFMAFHKHKVNMGCDWFLMPLPIGGGAVVDTVVRFKEGNFNQQYVPVNNWTVSATLEVQERPVFTEEVLDFYLGIGFSENELTNLVAASIDFHYCVHTTLQTNLN